MCFNVIIAVCPITDLHDLTDFGITLSLYRRHAGIRACSARYLEMVNFRRDGRVGGHIRRVRMFSYTLIGRHRVLGGQCVRTPRVRSAVVTRHAGTIQWWAFTVQLGASRANTALQPVGLYEPFALEV